jgi:hypothetical protein
MLAKRCTGLVGLLVVLGGSGALADDYSAEGVLKAHGLTRSGVFFIVASESEAIENTQLKVRPLVQYMAQAHGKFAVVLENEMLLEEAEDYKIRVVSEIGNVDLALPDMPRRNILEKQQALQAQQWRNQLSKELNVTNNQIAALHRRQVPQGVKMKLEKDFEQKRSDFLSAAADLRPLADKTMGEYNELKGNASVKNALNAYKQLTKANIPLGPSKDFVKAIQFVKSAERTYSPETAAPNKKKKKPASLKGSRAAMSSKKAATGSSGANDDAKLSSP